MTFLVPLWDTNVYRYLLLYMFLDWTQSGQNHYWVRFISKLQVVARDSPRAKLDRTAESLHLHPS